MKQTINNNFSRQFLGLGIVILSVIFAFGCSRTTAPANGNTAANSNSANTNTANSNTANTNTANSNTANTNSANSNTAAAKSIKDEILGTWIQGESGSAKIKMVITKDEMTKFDNDKQEDIYKYTWINDKEIEVVFKGQKVPTKVTVTGDEMTLDMMGMAVPYKRESGNSSNTASPNSDSAKKDGATEDKADCEVKKDNADFFVSATEKEMKLKKGTSIMDTDAEMRQGIITVKVKVGNEWIKGEIPLDDTTCNDAP